MDWLITIVIVSLIIYGVSKRKKTENKENEFETELSPTGKKEKHSFLTAGIIVVVIVLCVVGYFTHRVRLIPANYTRSEYTPITERKILRTEQWYEYNANGFLACIKYKDGSKTYYEYDRRGNQIYVKDCLNICGKMVTDETYYEDDDNNNVVHMKRRDSDVWWGYKYDNDGHKIEVRKEDYRNGDLEGWEVRKYDDRGNLIYNENSSDWKEWYKYDANNNSTYFKQVHFDVTTCEVTTVYDYDENGNKTHERISNGFEKWFEYDWRNNVIHERHSNGMEVWRNYDVQNNLIYEKKSNGFEKWFEYEYDDKNRKTHFIEYTNGKNEF